jgi:hypothetical protein
VRRTTMMMMMMRRRRSCGVQKEHRQEHEHAQGQQGRTGGG